MSGWFEALTASARTLTIAAQVNYVARLLVAGASYPRLGEAFHACNPILVLPTSLVPRPLRGVRRSLRGRYEKGPGIYCLRMRE